MPYITINDLPFKENMKGYKARMIHSEKMTTVYYSVEAGAAFPEHSHIHEQISNVIEGKFEFNLDGKVEVLEAGKIVVIPANTLHSGIALTNCTIIDVFAPVREDYR
ncbi:MAG: cupin domain-containing protein [Bacteroidota bacterium]